MDTDEHRFCQESAISRELYADSTSGGEHLAARDRGLEAPPFVSICVHPWLPRASAFCILHSSFPPRWLEGSLRVA